MTQVSVFAAENRSLNEQQRANSDCQTYQRSV